MFKKAVIIFVVGAAVAAGLFWLKSHRLARESELALARSLVEEGDSDQAVGKLKELAFMSRHSTARDEARLLLARVYMQQGELEPARLLWEELSADSASQFYEEALYHLGLVAYLRNETELSTRLWKEHHRLYPQSPRGGYALLAQAQRERKAEDFARARRTYLEILERYPASPVVEQTRQELGEVNLSLLFSPAAGPGFGDYIVRGGDTLSSIAARHQTTPELLAKINRIEGALIHPGQKLKVPLERFQAVVSKSQNTLMLLYGGEFFKLYQVGTGEGGSTPTGEFQIVTKLVNPPWFHSGTMIPSHDPRNILGSRWLGFQDPYAAYGIHGTIEPETIGSQSSAGCVRMLSHDVEELFDLLPRQARVLVLE